MCVDYWGQWDREEIVSMLDVPEDEAAFNMCCIELDNDETECNAGSYERPYTFQFMEEW